MANLVEMRPFPDPAVLGMLDVWTSGQVQLAEVIRWQRNYLDKGIPVRRQTTLAHTYGFSILGGVALQLLRPIDRAPYDYPLMMRGLLVHDHGEGELCRDVAGTEKKDEDDLAEYLAFAERFKKLPAAVFAEFERSFLLQFAERNAEIFPDHARAIMRNLWRMKRAECVLFRAIENWDYLLFAMEQYFERGIRENLYNMIVGCGPIYDEVAPEIRGWTEHFWTPAVRAWCLEFVELHKPFYGKEKS